MEAKDILNSQMSDKNKIKAIVFLVLNKNKATDIIKINDILSKNGIQKISSQLFSKIKRQKYPPACLLELLFQQKYQIEKGRYITNKEIAYYYHSMMKKINSSNKQIGNKFLLQKFEVGTNSQKFEVLVHNLNKYQKKSKQAYEIRKHIKQMLKLSDVKYSQKYQYLTGRKLNKNKIALFNKILTQKGLIGINQGYSAHGMVKLNTLNFVECDIKEIINVLQKKEVIKQWQPYFKFAQFMNPFKNA